MNKRSPVSEIMTRQVIVAHMTNSFSQVMEFFNTWRIQHLPVALGDHIIGICSINDVIGFTYKHLSRGNKMDLADFDQHFVMKEFMTPDPVCLSPDTPLEEAFSILAKGEFQSLPIVQNDKLVGIVTNKDLVKIYGELL